MEFQSNRSVNMYLHLIKVISVFIMGSFGMHLLVMLIDYYLMIKPFYLNLRENFVGTIFSTPMYPMMGVYGLYSLGIYFLWERKKKAMLLAREKEVQNEKVEAVLKTMQRITGMLVEHIATHNSEIMSWVEFRKRQGRPVSGRVENSNKKIAQALHSLSEISFVLPYSENRPENVGDIEKILHDKIGEITEFQKN
ncbi:MAG: hypothetical protein ACYS0I_13240 [Planctomycetota bacterium]|jgi:hypothetical protein